MVGNGRGNEVGDVRTFLALPALEMEEVLAYMSGYERGGEVG
jgi:hypothetical protein